MFLNEVKTNHTQVHRHTAAPATRLHSFCILLHSAFCLLNVVRPLQADREATASRLAEARQQLTEAAAVAQRAAASAVAQRAAAEAAALEAKAAELASLRSQLER